MRISIIDGTTPLPTGMLREDGVLALHPNAYYDGISGNSLRLWCHLNTRYGLPTQELVLFFKTFIGTRRTIEIGSGNGDLAYHLGIPATDNWVQKFPDVKIMYEAMSQPVIQYPESVEKLEASAAIEKYQPEIVIGSWVTQWIDPKQPPPPGGGSIYGVKEDEIIAAGLTYIVIGNLSVHGGKKIMQLPHKELAFDFLRSRAIQPELNRIWIWNQKR
jgi:hypothetical protein